MKEIGSEFFLYNSDNHYFKRIKDKSNSVFYLRSGRDAIGFVSDLIEKKSGVVLMPAYCCSSMSDPFVIRGWDIVYYPINSDFSADVSYILMICEKYHPDIVLVMNFFGLSETLHLTNQVKSKFPETRIIEDVTHILFDLDKELNRNIDFWVGSIRKWFGITDGAIAIIKGRHKTAVKYAKNDFVTLRKKALKFKAEYIHTNESILKKRYRELFAEAEISLGKGETPQLISPASHKYLDKLDIKFLKKSRQWNAITLIELLKSIPNIKLPDNIHLVSSKTPFMIPVFVKDRDNLQKQLAENGIFVPILWPLDENARKISPIALEFEKTMLAIPIDQRYDHSDMEHVYNTLKNILR